MRLAMAWVKRRQLFLDAQTVMGQHRKLRRSKMKRLFTFAVAAALAASMSTMAWSQSGGGSVGARSSNNPQSRSRASQLNRQYMGYNAFNDARIRRQLNLSQDQIRQLRALNNNWRQQLQRFQRVAGNNLHSVDHSQWNQMWQQYATMVNNVLTAQQQQTWSQLVGQFHTSSPNTMLGPTGATATTNSRAGLVSTGRSSATDPTAPKFGTNAVDEIGPDRIIPNTQANRGRGSSAIGTAQVTGEPIGLSRTGATQAQGGGGSSAVGTAVVNGDAIGTNQPGRTQVQQGGGSSLFGTLLL
jgi:hypothetical protein